jgi:hypothetical protein
MATPIRYQPDEAGTNELMNSPEMVALMLRAADAGRDFARTISPVSGKDHQHYIDSFETSAHARGGPKGNRAAGILANTSDHAWEVEWRNRDDEGAEGRHVLGRAVDFIEGGAW